MVSVIVQYMVVLLLATRRSVLGVEEATTDIPDNKRHIIEYQDCEDKVMRTIALEGRPSYKALIRDTNKYLLYTRENPDQPRELYEKSIASIAGSTFNSPDQTVIIVHGWNGSWKSKINLTIKDAFLGAIYANIIVVDWSAVAASDYATASQFAPRVGKFVGQFLQFLHRKVGAPYSTMHLVGLGLGAHVVGNAANFLHPVALVARITGLDPAGPLWVNNTKRLKATDALYVEIIHTDSKMLGSFSRFGDVDFYPNGGMLQPGCSVRLHDSCSHMRSWELFAATVKYNHLVGRRCASNQALGLNMCFHDFLPMGNDDLLKNGSGVFRLTTNSKYPYAQIL